MSKYQVMAKPGDFNARRSKAVDQSAKIEKEAARQIRGMNAARDLKAQQEQVYLRAMQFAHSSEEKSRETNYKLETENRRDFAKARQQDLKYQIENAKAAASQQPEQSLMEELAPLIPKFAEVIGQVGQQNAKNERDAATVAAYQHGFTLDTLQNVLKLNSQLTLSQFQATEYIQGLREQGWAEENINALYEQQYLTRGSKAWVDNKALALNSIREFETGLATHVANMQEMTADQRILEVQNYTQDWLTRVNINGRPLSLEVMDTVIFPKVRSAERRVLNELQKDQIEDRDSALINDRNRNYLVLFKDGGGALGLMEELGRNPSAEKRAGLLQWAEQAHKSGALSDDDLRKIANTTFLHNNKMATIGEHFVDENTAAFGEYVRNLEKQELQRLRQRKGDMKILAEAEIREAYNLAVSEGRDMDSELMQELQNIGKERYGPDFSSTFLDALKKELPENRGAEAAMPLLLEMVENGQGMESLENFHATNKMLDTPLPDGSTLRQRATRNDKAGKDQIHTRYKKLLREELASSTGIKNSMLAQSDAKFEYEIIYREKEYMEKFWKLYNQSGGDLLGSADKAMADGINSIKKYVEDAEARGFDLPRLADDAREMKTDEAALLRYRQDLRRTRYFKQSRETLAYVIGKERFMEATQAMKTPGGQIPPAFKLAAETFRMTPMKLQQHIASVWGEKPIDTSNSTLQSFIDSLPPEKLSLVTQPYGSPARIQRAITNRYSLQSAPVRQSMPQSYEQYNTNRVIGDINVDALRDAVIVGESGWDSTAENKDSGARGFGQILPGNIPKWSKAALGREVSLQEFENNPGIQMQIINDRFVKMVNDIVGAGYSGDEAIRRIAAIWYSGQHNLYDYDGKEVGKKTGKPYPSIQKYTLNVLDRYKGLI